MLIFLNFSERKILWSLCLVDFYAFVLKLPIQTSISVPPELPVSLSSHVKCPDFRKTSTPLRIPIPKYKGGQLIDKESFKVSEDRCSPVVGG